MGNDNGNDERLIERAGPKVLQQIIISLVEVAQGATATNVQINCADELAARGLLDKGRVVLDEHYRLQTQPKVTPVSTDIARGLLRHLRG